LKRVGAMNLINADTDFESDGMATFTRVQGMDADEAHEAHGVCERAVEACRNKHYHVYSLKYVCQLDCRG
jgi:hypothetical protein